MSAIAFCDRCGWMVPGRDAEVGAATVCPNCGAAIAEAADHAAANAEPVSPADQLNPYASPRDLRPAVAGSPSEGGARTVANAGAGDGLEPVARAALHRVATGLWLVNASNFLLLAATILAFVVACEAIFASQAAKAPHDLDAIAAELTIVSWIVIVAAAVGWIAALAGAAQCLNAPSSAERNGLIWASIIATFASGAIDLAWSLAGESWSTLVVSGVLDFAGSLAFMLFLCNLTMYLRDDRLVRRSGIVYVASIVLFLLTLTDAAILLVGIAKAEAEQNVFETILVGGGAAEAAGIFALILSVAWIALGLVYISVIHETRRAILAKVPQFAVGGRVSWN